VLESMMVVLEAVKAMSPEDFRRSLQDAGITDENGELTQPYRQGKMKEKPACDLLITNDKGVQEEC